MYLTKCATMSVSNRPAGTEFNFSRGVCPNVLSPQLAHVVELAGIVCEHLRHFIDRLAWVVGGGSWGDGMVEFDY